LFFTRCESLISMHGRFLRELKNLRCIDILIFVIFITLAGSAIRFPLRLQQRQQQILYTCICTFGRFTLAPRSYPPTRCALCHLRHTNGNCLDLNVLFFRSFSQTTRTSIAFFSKPRLGSLWSRQLKSLWTDSHIQYP